MLSSFVQKRKMEKQKTDEAACRVRDAAALSPPALSWLLAGGLGKARLAKGGKAPAGTAQRTVTNPGSKLRHFLATDAHGLTRMGQN